MKKIFLGELMRMRDLLRDRVPFGLSRFGHAELEMLRGKLLHDREVSGGHEYRYAPADPDNAVSRQRLWDSFTFKAPNYFVGINCPHCNITDEQFEWMRENSGQTEDQLTFATIYFYSNYRPYLTHVLPLFSQYNTVLVCHELGIIENLPFQPVRVFRNQYDAWRKNLSLADELKSYIADEKIRGGLFLFCAGALGCILAHEVYAFCPENTCIDIGSSLDPYLFTGALARNRRYLKQDPEAQASESCHWKPRKIETSGAAD